MKRKLVILELLCVAALSVGCGKSDEPVDKKTDITGTSDTYGKKNEHDKKADESVDTDVTVEKPAENDKPADDDKKFESTGFIFTGHDYDDEIGASNVGAYNDYKCYSLSELCDSEYADQVCHVVYDKDKDKHSVRFSNVIDGTVMPSAIVYTKHANSGWYYRYVVDTDFWAAESCEEFLKNYYTSAARDDEDKLSFDDYKEQYFSVSSDSRESAKEFGDSYVAQIDTLANTIQDSSEGFNADTVGRLNIRFKTNGYDSESEFMSYCYYVDQDTWSENYDISETMLVYDDLGINVYFDDRDEKQGKGSYTAYFNYFSPVFDADRFNELCAEKYGDLDGQVLTINDSTWSVCDAEISDGESIIPFTYMTNYADWYALSNKYGDYGIGETYNGFVYTKIDEDQYILVTSPAQGLSGYEEKPIACMTFENLNYEDLNKIYRLFKAEAIGRE